MQPKQQDYSRLEELYQREQTALAKLEGFLLKGEDAIGRVEGLIDHGNANGLDTSVLSAALSTFESSLATVQSAFNSASTILASHAGFNGSGKVMDRAEAVQTLKEAGAAMKSAGSTLKDPRSILKAAVQSWIQANKGAFNDTLKQLYQKEQEWLSTQGNNISRLNDASGKIQAFIAKARGVEKIHPAWKLLLQALLHNCHNLNHFTMQPHQFLPVMPDLTKMEL